MGISPVAAACILLHGLSTSIVLKVIKVLDRKTISNEMSFWRLKFLGFKYRVRIFLKKYVRHLQGTLFWRWRLKLMQDPATETGRIFWLGGLSDISLLNMYFGFRDVPSTNVLNKRRNIFIAKLPFSGALKVPVYLDSIIDLTIPFDVIVSRCGENVRRIVRRESDQLSVRCVTNEDEVLRINAEMIQPFADARHGSGAVHISSNEVINYSKGKWGGSLVVLERNGIAVACHIGFETYPYGQKTWNALRFGYPVNVFSDKKILADINTLNVFLAAKWAQSQGYRSYNLGMSPGQPDGSLLQWKCRRGAYPDCNATSEFVYLRVPICERPLFFWFKPVFYATKGGLGLCLGVPCTVDASALVIRVSSLTYSRLKVVKIYTDFKVPNECTTKVSSMIRKYSSEADISWINIA